MEENIKQKKNRRKRIQKKLLQAFIIIFSLALLIVSLITLACTVKFHDLAFGRISFYIMRTDSKPVVADKGDLVIVEKLEKGNYNVGDYIVYGDNKTYYCDSVAEVKNVNVINKLITADVGGVRYRFNEDQIQGKAIKRVRRIGNVITFLRTPVGIVFFIIYIICLFALLRLLITYGEDKEDDDDKYDRNNELHSNENSK